MPIQIRVEDEYRINQLSLQPGGSTLTMFYGDGSTLSYDKIKNVTAYIRKVKTEGLEKIEANGEVIWRR